MLSKPAELAAFTVSSLATASKDAGMVRYIACSSSRSLLSLATVWFHAALRWRRYEAEATIGESFCTSSGASAGRIGAVRSTPV